MVAEPAVVVAVLIIRPNLTTRPGFEPELKTRNAGFTILFETSSGRLPSVNLSTVMPHIHDKIDFTVEVFIVYKNKVLLRKHDKYKIWLSVGGHIELDEDPNQAAIREVKEETGLDVSMVGKILEFEEPEGYQELIPPKFLNRHKINDSHEHVTMVYFGSALNDKVIQGQNEISDDIRWFTFKELDDPNYNIRENIKYYAKKALEELGEKH